MKQSQSSGEGVPKPQGFEAPPRRDEQRHAAVGLEDAVRPEDPADLETVGLDTMGLVEDAIRARQLAEKLNRELRAEIAERQQTEERLRFDAAELQEADRRKNHFLAMLGHELRNPLAAIRGGVLLLRSEKARPESRAAALPIVAQQVAHLERLVDDLLDITRVIQGGLLVRREPMAVQEALQRALEMLRSQAETGGFVIDVREPALPLDLLGDRVRLTQVFLNVLGNAVKYSGRSRRIEVSATREGDAAVVCIRDFGIGVPPELLSRIFEPFMQAPNPLSLQPGLGLGLAVVRELVRLHGGEVEAFSAGLGKGCELIVRLPLIAAAP